MRTTKAHEEISYHKLPCGPMTVSINSVCRKKLGDTFNALLDRLCEECHPEPTKPEAPKNHEFDDKGNVVKQGEAKKKSRDEKKQEMIDAGKLRAEVATEVNKYKEEMMGNSKMLQNISGKIEKR